MWKTFMNTDFALSFLFICLQAYTVFNLLNMLVYKLNTLKKKILHFVIQKSIVYIIGTIVLGSVILIRLTSRYLRRCVRHFEAGKMR